MRWLAEILNGCAGFADVQVLYAQKNAICLPIVIGTNSVFLWRINLLHCSITAQPFNISPLLRCYLVGCDSDSVRGAGG